MCRPPVFAMGLRDPRRLASTCFSASASRSKARRSHLNSTGLSTLVQGTKQSRMQDGDLYICGLQQPVRIIFELTRLDKFFEIFPAEEDAIAAFAL